MDLDKRILDGKKPLDCFDTDIAKQFIGKKGLFGSHESQFMNLDTCPKCVVDELKEVDNYDDYPFITSGNHSYRLFLPTEWVMKEEPAPKHIDFELAKKDKNFDTCNLYGEELVFDTKNNIFYTSDGNVHEYLTAMAQHNFQEEQTKEVIEKKYRPFTGIEFAEKFNLKLGGIIRLREKKHEYALTQYEYKIVFTGYRWCGDVFEVFLNGKWYTMHTLFENYEYFENDEWHKFGIEVEE